MSIPKFKRKPNGLEYVDNSYVIQVETLRLVSKLNKKWTDIYIIPIEKYVCKQAELVSMANSVNPIRYEDILLRRVFLLLSKSCLDILDKKLTDMVEVLYTNPKSCFGRKNGKSYTISEAREMLDKRLEILGTLYDKQYKLLKGVLESDNKKLKKINDKEIDDDKIIDLLVSKFVKKMIFDNF